MPNLHGAISCWAAEAPHNKLLRIQAQTASMRDEIANRARAVECLLKANRAHKQAERDAWLTLCESWLTLSEFERSKDVARHKCGGIAATTLFDDADLAAELD
jgi:hypothetical protein